MSIIDIFWYSEWLHNFSSPASEHAQALFDFHNYAMFYIVMVIVFVIFAIRYALSYIVTDQTNQFEFEGNFVWINNFFKKLSHVKQFEHILFKHKLRYYDNSAETAQCLKVRSGYLDLLRLKTRFMVMGNDLIVTHMFNSFEEDVWVVKYLIRLTSTKTTRLYGVWLYQHLMAMWTCDDDIKPTLRHVLAFINLPKVFYKQWRLHADTEITPINWEWEKEIFFHTVWISKNIWSHFYIFDASYQQNVWRFNHYAILSDSLWRNDTLIWKSSVQYLFGPTNYSLVWVRKKFSTSNCLITKRLNDFSVHFPLTKLHFFRNKGIIRAITHFRNFKHSTNVELIWTSIPSFILLLILYPSMMLLYGYDKPYVTDPYITFKAVAHQWYWTYEYGDIDALPDSVFFKIRDELMAKLYKKMRTSREILKPLSLSFTQIEHYFEFCEIFVLSHLIPEFKREKPLTKIFFNLWELIFTKPISFDSYLIYESDLPKGGLRLLETDKRIVLPTGLCIRLVTTSTDVIHSWAVPMLGSKIDSVPGRLNQQFMVINKPGVYYGQCSEICGVNHGFMPIMVEAVSPKNYMRHYINMKLDDVLDLYSSFKNPMFESDLDCLNKSYLAFVQGSKPEYVEFFDKELKDITGITLTK